MNWIRLVIWFPELEPVPTNLVYAGHELSFRPRILFGIGEEGGGQSADRFKALGWGGFPRYSPSLPCIPVSLVFPRKQNIQGWAKRNRSIRMALISGHCAGSSKPRPLIGRKI